MMNIRTFEHLNIRMVNKTVLVLLFYCSIVLLFFYSAAPAVAQLSKIDSLLSILKTAKEDTNKVNILNAISKQLWQGGRNYDTAFIHAENAKRLAQKIDFKKGVANAYNNIGAIYTLQGNYPEALKNYFASLKIKEEIGQTKDPRYANTINHIGNVYYEQGNYPEALKNHFASLKIREEIGDKQGIAGSYNNIGIIYDRQGNYPEALKNYFASLKIKEEIRDKQGIAGSYNNIGSIYMNQGNYPEALKNHFASLKIFEEIGSQKGIAHSCNNIGNIYALQSNYPEALKNHFASLKIKEEIGDKKGIAMSYNNIGCIYSDQGKAHPNPSQREGLYNEALKNHFTSLKIREEIGDKRGIASSYINIGSVELKLNNTAEAKKCLQNALSLSKEIGSKDRIKDSYSGLAETDSALGNYKSAYQNYKMYILYRDSLLNEENTKKTVQTQMQYEFDKKESLAKAEQEKKDAIVAEEKRQQKIITYSISGGFVLVLLLALFIFRGYKQKQKANKELAEKNSVIAEQKKLVEEKNKDITDSINYAQRIQKALLASDSLLASTLKGEFAQDYFILFKPKDIVSGDFYWATVVKEGEKVRREESENEPHTLTLSHSLSERFYLAVCDSTGHGVPGAFMSLLNISFLNEAINEEELIHPNEIFNHVRQRLIENISSEGAKDGMDGILLKFQVPNYKSQVPSEQPSVIIEYAASNNAPVLINSSLQELDCDNMPVGISDRKNSFTLHAVPLPNGKGSGDGLGVLYLFTDGFADQFGGPKDKKFKTKLLKQKLMEISHLPMEEQKKVLEQTFNEWKGSREQTDDVLVVGIKI